LGARLRDLDKGLDPDQTTIHGLDLSIQVDHPISQLLDPRAGGAQLFLDDLDARFRY
jgi:hypothetical protein